MSADLFMEALNQEIINLIDIGCDPVSVYEYAYHKAEGAAFFAMLYGHDGQSELTKISHLFGHMMKREKMKAQPAVEHEIASRPGTKKPTAPCLLSDLT